MKKLLFIINPRAGKTKSREPLFDASSVFCEAGYLVNIQRTAARGDATLLARELGAEYDAVACYGGDGTLNETLNGLMRLPREKRPPVCYLPGGSTNDFATSLGISSDPVEAAHAAGRGKPLTIDVGRFGERWFSYVASFGAFTRTSYSVSQDAKNMLGHLAYLLGGAKDLETLHPYRMKLTADDEVIDGEFIFGAVSNSTSIAGFMKLAEEQVSFCDGVFELMLVPVPRTPAALQSLIFTLMNQSYESSESVIFRHVRKVVAETEENIPWTLDGEYAPSVPRVELSVEEHGLTLLL